MNAFKDLHNKGIIYKICVYDKCSQLTVMTEHRRGYVESDLNLIENTIEEILADLSKKYYEAQGDININNICVWRYA